MHRLPGGLLAFGALVFAAGLAAALGVPATIIPALVGIAVGVLFAIVGLILESNRRRIPALLTPAMRLNHRFVSGQALRASVKVIRDAGTIWDQSAATRVSDWETGFWADLAIVVPLREPLYRKSEPPVPPADAGDWSRAVVNVLERRLTLLRELILEVPYQDV